MAGTITPPLVQHLRITGLAHRDLNRGFVGTENKLACSAIQLSHRGSQCSDDHWSLDVFCIEEKKYEAEISELLNLFYQMREKCSGLKQDKRGCFVKYEGSEGREVQNCRNKF